MATETAVELTAVEYLSRADKELAFGNHRKAAGYLWKATEATFIGLARARELDCGDLSAVAVALEKAEGRKGSIPAKQDYHSNLIHAKTLREHAEWELLERYELDDNYELTRAFLVQCNGESE